MIFKNRRTPCRTAAGALGACLINSTLVIALGATPVSPHREAAAPSAASAIASAPVSFEVNVGQVDPSVKFLARSGGHTAFVTDKKLILVVPGEPERPRDALAERPFGKAAPESEPRQGAAVEISFLGRRDGTVTAGLEPLAHRVNYLRGNDPATWITHVPTYAKVRVAGVYPGVDVVYSGAEGSLKYDFVVAPDADPSAIRMKIDGADAVEVTEAGDLVLRAGGREIVQRAPRAVDADGRAVDARYTVAEDRIVGIELGARDASKRLSVAPELVYSTYLGGAAGLEPGETSAYAVRVDADGAAYVGGVTSSVDLPVTPGVVQPRVRGHQDIFVAKLSPDGSSLLYSTYFGSSGIDDLKDLAVDAEGAVYLTGVTVAGDFPVTPGSPEMRAPDGRYTVFVTKIVPDGVALAYSAVLAGDGAVSATSIAVGADGAAYVGAQVEEFSSSEQPFPTTPNAYDTTYNGSRDAIVFKLDPTGTSLEYSTYLGGSRADWGAHLAVDATGAVYVAGTTFTNSALVPFPTTPGAFRTTPAGGDDIFVTKLSPTGQELVYSTLIGSQAGDTLDDLQIDAAGNVYIAGVATTMATIPFPTTAGVYQPSGTGAFVTKLNATGSALVYSTLISNGFAGTVRDLSVGPTGAAYVVGEGWLLSSLSQAAMVAGLSPDATSLDLSMEIDTPAEVERGLGVDVGSDGAVYVVGSTESATFPTTPGSLDTELSGKRAAFVAKIDPGDGSFLYSTLVDGPHAQSPGESALGVAADADGAAYVVGNTMSTDFPVQGGIDGELGGNLDIFVTKIAPSGGALVYSTYIGGLVGGSDGGNAIAVDATGAAYITGLTQSQDFPTTEGAFDRTYGGSSGDAYVTKLAPDGASLLYSTFLGGDVHFNSLERAFGIAVDDAGAAYVAGVTASDGFPTTPGAFSRTRAGRDDCFVTKLSPDGGSLVYSTLLGGTEMDVLNGLAVGADGSAYVTGFTWSTDTPVRFPTTPDAFQAEATYSVTSFVTRLAPDGGALLYSTFLGGSLGSEAYAVAVDADGAAYVTGRTSSLDFPLVNPYDDTMGFYDVFVTKIAPSGASLVYSTFIGNYYGEFGYGIAVDARGAATVVGITAYDVSAPKGAPYPTTPNAIQREPPGGSSAFVTRLTPSGDALIYSTFLGGSLYQGANAVAVDASGAIYVAGSTESYDFPLFNPYQPHREGVGDAFVAKIALPTPSSDTPGVYVPQTGVWFLRNANAGGNADTTFFYGPGGAGFVPIRGDWDGDGGDTPGVYDPASGTFFLKNSNDNGPANTVFLFGVGNAGYVPLAGDWNGDGLDTIGLYNPASGAFFLKDTNAGGTADEVFLFGVGGAGWVPILGDWNGDGADTVGLYDPATGTFFLKDANENGPADTVFLFGVGNAGYVPLAGDWNGDGFDTVGLYAPSTATFFLRNTNAVGVADLAFTYGVPGLVPIAGDWDGE